MSLAPWGYTLLATGALPQVLPTREQEGFTLGFHIVLVPFGVASTFLMLLFALGAVSGTIPSLSGENASRVRFAAFPSPYPCAPQPTSRYATPEIGKKLLAVARRVNRARKKRGPPRSHQRSLRTPLRTPRSCPIDRGRPRRLPRRASCS